MKLIKPNLQSIQVQKTFGKVSRDVSPMMAPVNLLKKNAADKSPNSSISLLSVTKKAKKVDSPSKKP